MPNSKTTWSKLVQGKGFEDQTRDIGRETIPVKYGKINIHDLNFYHKNPRVGSKVKKGASKEEIIVIMARMKHVGELKKKIKAAGKNTERVIVLDGSMEVIEGNSRLAAFLSIDDPKLQEMNCEVLPKDTNEDLILSLLGQIHIDGKTQWDKYDLAYWLRDAKNIDTSSKKTEWLEKAKLMNLTSGKAQHLVRTIDLMDEYKEPNGDKYQYYQVLTTNSKMKKLLGSGEKVPAAKKPIIDDLVSALKSHTVSTEFRREVSELTKHERAWSQFTTNKRDYSSAVNLAKNSSLNTSLGHRIATIHDSIDKLRRQVPKMGLDTYEVSSLNAADTKFRNLTKAVSDLNRILNTATHGVIQIRDKKGNKKANR